jgi:MFS family permease
MVAHRMMTRAWWTVLGSAVSLIFGNGPVMQFTFGVFMKPIADDLLLSRATLSVVLTIGLCTTGLCVPIAGRLVDRYGPRKVTLPAIVLMGIGMMLPAFATRPWHLIAAYALLGVAAAGQTPLPYARIVASSFVERRGFALGLTMAGVGLGTMLLPQYASHLISGFGWRSAYLCIGATVISVAAPTFYVLVRERPADGHPVTDGELPGLTVSEALHQRSFWLITGACFLTTLTAAGILAHIVPLLVDRGGDPGRAAAAISAAGLAMIMGRIMSGLLLDRFSAPSVAAGFFAIQGLGVAVLLTASSTAGATLATFLVGLGLGAEVDLIAFMLARYYGMRAYGSLYGLLFGAFMLAGGTGPLVMGWAYSMTGSYDASLIAFEASVAVAVVLMLVLRSSDVRGRPRRGSGGHLGHASTN